MHPKDAAGIANSIDPDPSLVWSGSALFAKIYLSENLGFLRYWHDVDLVLDVVIYWLDVVIYWLDVML